MDGYGMDLMIDMRVAELLASRLCHDLVGPIGAVNNGMELMEDESFGMAEDAMTLAANSAGQASNLLQFYRLAYGMAGQRQGGDFGPTRELAAGFLTHSKSQLDWPAGPVPEGLPDGTVKMLLNLIALAAEALPRGGTVGISIVRGSAGFELEVKAVGADAGLREEAQAAIGEDAAVEDLTPRNVHGYFTRLLAKRLGGDLVAEQIGRGALSLAVTVPG
jgi:histidine phosphotransferase ChpT